MTPKVETFIQDKINDYQFEIDRFDVKIARCEYHKIRYGTDYATQLQWLKTQKKILTHKKRRYQKMIERNSGQLVLTF